jgi:hypothetical protein
MHLTLTSRAAALACDVEDPGRPARRVPGGVDDARRVDPSDAPDLSIGVGAATVQRKLGVHGGTHVRHGLH